MTVGTSAMVFMAVVAIAVILLGARRMSSTPIRYGCPGSCLGVVKVEGENAIETVNIGTGEHREWRFCADPPVNGLMYPGYVIEMRVIETGPCQALDEPASDPPVHIVRGKDMKRAAYRVISPVVKEDGDDRPVLARNCNNTLDDRDVVCDGGEAQFSEQLSQR